MNISNFDLNLLRVFDALMREQNVSRAAARLSLSQPAVSNALSRLRALVNDPLLVRVGRSMQPTSRAQALEAPIRAALQQIEQSLSATPIFDPATSRQQFSIAVTDYVELICMPALLRKLSEQAPGMRIDIRHLTPNLPMAALDQGEVDLLLGRFDQVPARFSCQHWMSETLQLALCRDHPLAQQVIDLERFIQLRHLWVSGGQTRGMVDQWLAEHGLARTIHYTTPNYLQAAHLIAGSELAAVLPRRLAEHFTQLLPLQLHDLPFNLGPFHLQMVSLAARQREPALHWLMEQIKLIGQR
ncbi:LysR family transcriptional regulator [Pseudomonas sp. 5P_3.1_Bac2]|uniref:LysR family transcriptional regulator n=1 Tax=Pseudomonas sp. 5P_3.1_Bac2 TaxID=2971617 RepID=UPI0021CA4B17|nr:LysR family transcriptional regulator [Pseudomonas sp. 5P_3.1_Bac2]MCU1718525.1 LysR family transcriptional regulator [Pseudomonas sp. 5P_3.1_Bac2]